MGCAVSKSDFSCGYGFGFNAIYGLGVGLVAFAAWLWLFGSSAGSSVAGSSPAWAKKQIAPSSYRISRRASWRLCWRPPCSAPFLGTAVGFALTLNTADTLLIFFAMATGFAAPWLIFAAVPQGARFLPRPGAWMERLERLLGFGLLLTALWLISLLDGAIAWMAVALLGMLLMLLRQKIKGRAEGKVKRQAKAKPIAWSHRELDCCRAVVALWAR